MLYNLQVWCFRHLFFSTNTTHIFKKHQELVSVYSFKKKKRSHSLHQFQNQMGPWMLFSSEPGDVPTLTRFESERDFLPTTWMKVRPPEGTREDLGPGSTKRKIKTSLLDPKCPWKTKVLSPSNMGYNPKKGRLWVLMVDTMTPPCLRKIEFKFMVRNAHHLLEGSPLLPIFWIEPCIYT